MKPFIRKSRTFDGVSHSYPDIIGAYEKIRFSTKDLPESQFLYGEQAPEPLLVTENGVQFATYLNEGLMTGIFCIKRSSWSISRWFCSR